MVIGAIVMVLWEYYSRIEDLESRFSMINVKPAIAIQFTTIQRDRKSLHSGNQSASVNSVFITLLMNHYCFDACESHTLREGELHGDRTDRIASNQFYFFEITKLRLLRLSGVVGVVLNCFALQSIWPSGWAFQYASESANNFQNSKILNEHLNFAVRWRVRIALMRCQLTFECRSCSAHTYNPRQLRPLKLQPQNDRFENIQHFLCATVVN